MSWLRRTPLDGARWISIDCETSGLDMRRDRLLSVGAVPVCDGRIRPGASFSGFVRQDAPSESANILVHGIGGDAQMSGAPLEEVMRGLAAAADGRIPVGFHAPFDEAVLRRHGFRAGGRWVDLAVLAPALFAEHREVRALEDWLRVFEIEIQARHDALGDAFSTAQLLLVVLSEARRQGVHTVEALRALQRDRRWLQSQ